MSIMLADDSSIGTFKFAQDHLASPSREPPTITSQTDTWADHQLKQLAEVHNKSLPMPETYRWRVSALELHKETLRSEHFSLCGEPFSLGLWPRGGMVQLPARVPEGEESAALSLRYEGSKEAVQCEVVLRVLCPSDAAQHQESPPEEVALSGAAVRCTKPNLERSVGFERFCAFRDLLLPPSGRNSSGQPPPLAEADGSVTVEASVSCAEVSLAALKAEHRRRQDMEAALASGTLLGGPDGPGDEDEDEDEDEDDAAFDARMAAVFPVLVERGGAAARRGMLKHRLMDAFAGAAPTTRGLVEGQVAEAAASAKAWRALHAHAGQVPSLQARRVSSQRHEALRPATLKPTHRARVRAAPLPGDKKKKPPPPPPPQPPPQPPPLQGRAAHERTGTLLAEQGKASLRRGLLPAAQRVHPDASWAPPAGALQGEGRALHTHNLDTVKPQLPPNKAARPPAARLQAGSQHGQSGMAASPAPPSPAEAAAAGVVLGKAALPTNGRLGRFPRGPGQPGAAVPGAALGGGVGSLEQRAEQYVPRPYFMKGSSEGRAHAGYATNTPPLARSKAVLHPRTPTNSHDRVTVTYHSLEATSHGSQPSSAAPSDVWRPSKDIKVRADVAAAVACRRLLSHMNKERKTQQTIEETDFVIRDVKTGFEYHIDKHSDDPFVPI